MARAITASTSFYEDSMKNPSTVNPNIISTKTKSVTENKVHKNENEVMTSYKISLKYITTTRGHYIDYFLSELDQET